VRLNGQGAIREYLGGRASWKRLLAAGLPLYQDPEAPWHLWANTDELDVWDRRQCRPSQQR
jgi:hypothetical protein